jgi:hypothetical protein
MKSVLATVVCIAALVISGSALGANPGTQGQPSQSCQLIQPQPTGPAGLLSTTNGFATKAVLVYAGSLGTESAETGTTAVSQYDVACFQVSQPH